MSEYVKFHLRSKKQIVSLMRLKNLEETLPRSSFLRVHRSYIVNTKSISTVERNRIVFYGNVYIPVSDPYKEEFRKIVEGSFE